MTSTVRLRFSQPGLGAPVFVVTSMSEPQWIPLEMDFESDDNNNLTFYKDFDVAPGKHQYKFRLGPGDWWALDESKPSVHDDSGNRNNLIVVEGPSQLSTIDPISLDVSDIRKASASISTPISEQDAPLLKHETLAIEESTNPSEHQTEPSMQLPMFRHANLNVSNAPSVFDSDASSDHESDAPDAAVLGHESLPPQKGNADIDSAYHSQDVDDHASPLFRHESFISSADDDDDDDDSRFVVTDGPGVSSPTFDPDSHHDHGAPLLRHEISLDIDDTPLFRHESMFMNSTFDSFDDPTDSFDHDKELAALEDSGVHVDPFPTEREEIMRHLARVSTRLPEDEITIHGTPPSSPVPTTDESRRRSSSLRTGVMADSLNQLEPIKETEEPRSAMQAPHGKGGCPDNSPTDLLTPPMTPDLGAEERLDKMSSTLGSTLACDSAGEPLDTSRSAEDVISKPVADAVPATLSARVQNLFGGVKKRVSSNFDSRTFLAVIVGLAAAIAYKWQSLRLAVANRALRTFYPYAHDINLRHRSAA